MTTSSRPTQVDTVAHGSAFIELVCSDDELLKAEFDAIVAAAWASSSDGTGVIGDQDRPSVHGLSNPEPEELMSGRMVSDLCWRRQRSPPTAERATANGRLPPAHTRAGGNRLQ